MVGEAPMQLYVTEKDLNQTQSLSRFTKSSERSWT